MPHRIGQLLSIATIGITLHDRAANIADWKETIILKYSNNNKKLRYTNALIKKLEEHNVEATGEILYLSYDSPYKFYGRRNEVIVAVKY